MTKKRVFFVCVMFAKFYIKKNRSPISEMKGAGAALVDDGGEGEGEEKGR